MNQFEHLTEAQILNGVAEESEQTPVKRMCLCCAKPFTPKSDDPSTAFYHFCSWICLGEELKNNSYLFKECRFCRKPFIADYSGSNARQYFCSENCSNQYEAHFEGIQG